MGIYYENQNFFEDCWAQLHRGATEFDEIGPNWNKSSDPLAFYFGLRKYQEFLILLETNSPIISGEDNENDNSQFQQIHQHLLAKKGIFKDEEAMIGFPLKLKD